MRLDGPLLVVNAVLVWVSTAAMSANVYHIGLQSLYTKNSLCLLSVRIVMMLHLLCKKLLQGSSDSSKSSTSSQ